MSEPNNATTNLATWIEANATSLLQALEMAATKNEASALDVSDSNQLVKVLTESAQNWRDIAAELHGMWLALSPDDDYPDADDIAEAQADWDNEACA